MTIKSFTKQYVPGSRAAARWINRTYWQWVAFKVRTTRSVKSWWTRRMARVNVLGGKSEDRFDRIHRYNLWGNEESISGPGSTMAQTHYVREALPELCRELNIESFLDLPCGDYQWMNETRLPVAHYIGADVVGRLIELNRQKYIRDGVEFRKLNVLADELPRVDMIMCRDCLVHFSFKDIQSALRTVKRSRSKYFLTTIFTECQSNADIATGDWRKINLMRPPFNIPPPMKIINEKCPDQSQLDKSLALWKVDSLPEL